MTQYNPLQPFRFCPQCGHAGLETRQVRSIFCADCGFRFFFNCAATVGGLVFYEDQLILGVRAEEPQKGKLCFPGGFVEFDEAADHALRREIFEELNIEVTDMTFLTSAPNDYQFAGVHYKVCSSIFTCRAHDISQICANDDVADFCLISPHQLDPADLAFASARIGLAKFLEKGQM